MQETVKRRATCADLEQVPAHLVDEILDGQLVTHPRPAPRHAVVVPALASVLSGPFQRGRGGHGGWIFMSEPELRLGPDVVVPDVAGWRRERMANPPGTHWIETPPDWVCAVLSPSTEKYDRLEKRRIYADHGVGHIWFVDPRLRMLETFVLVQDVWHVGPTLLDAAVVSMAPFDAIAFPLGVLWPFDQPGEAQA